MFLQTDYNKGHLHEFCLDSTARGCSNRVQQGLDRLAAVVAVDVDHQLDHIGEREGRDEHAKQHVDRCEGPLFDCVRLEVAVADGCSRDQRKVKAIQHARTLAAVTGPVHLRRATR